MNREAKVFHYNCKCKKKKRLDIGTFRSERVARLGKAQKAVSEGANPRALKPTTSRPNHLPPQFSEPRHSPLHPSIFSLLLYFYDPRINTSSRQGWRRAALPHTYQHGLRNGSRAHRAPSDSPRSKARHPKSSRIKDLQIPRRSRTASTSD